MPSSKKVLLFFLFLAINVTADYALKVLAEKELIVQHNPDLSKQTILADQQVVRYPKVDATDDTTTEYDTLIIKEVVVIPNFWNFIYVRNYNVGFSLLSFLEKFTSAKNLSHYLKFVQLFGVLLIFYLFYSFEFKHPIAFNLIIAGGMGNVLDRFLNGYVIDYIKWYIPNSPFAIFNPWPIFNLADMFVSVGAGLLALMLILEALQTRQQPPSSESS